MRLARRSELPRVAGFEAEWPVLSFVVAGLELWIMHLIGETQWLTAQYVMAKRPSNVQNAREQEK
jgi:hypothetical protein